MPELHGTGPWRGGARWRAVPALALAMVLAACGSTVQIGDEPEAAAINDQDSEEVGVAGDQGLTLDGDGSSSAAEGPVVSDQPNEVADGGSFDLGGTVDDPGEPDTGGAAAAGSSASTTSSGPATSGQQRRGTYGPGVSDDEIVIGIAFPDEQSKENNENFLGASGITVGNQERYYEIMAESINTNGGIAGRAIRYSKYRYSTANGQNFSQLEQEACAQWTQDDPALVAAAFIPGGDSLKGCAKDAGLATWSSAFTGSDDRTYATYPTHIELSAIGLTRQGRILADGLESQGYFDTEQDALDTGDKLGVVTFDAPRWERAVNGSLEPALNRKGQEIDDKAWVKEVRSVNDLGEITAQIQSTVLRFKSNDITHVIIVDQQAVLTLLFLQSAENQDYRPRYGLTSQAGHTVIAKEVPERQLHGALGVGWLPQFDVPASERPENPAAAGCLAMFEEHGEEPADDNNRAVMLAICESIGFVKAALEAGLPDLTAESYARGAESLGEFASLNSFGNYVGPGRHDAAAYYRTVAYDSESGCVCFHYTSDLVADLPG